MDDDKLYQGLIKILKTFKNRPYHLAKYLVENNAFTESFIKKIINSNIIKYSDNTMTFQDINEMNEYFNSLLEETKKEKTLEEIAIDLNKKLEQLLKEEKYEEAIYIRDYMIKNNIPRINF